MARVLTGLLSRALMQMVIWGGRFLGIRWSKKYMIKRLLFLCLILPCLAFSQANKDSTFQNNQHKNIAATLNAYTTNYPTEKAYLQFDKPYYAIGDTVYFKAYVTIAAQHKLSAMSGILYAELINPDNKIAWSLKLQMLAGVAWGDFTLADTLKGGNYRVRAYTNWMRNEGETAFFEQTLLVGSAVAARIPESGQPKNKKAVANLTAKKFDVQFMPEGGSLVAGNYSKIAFKAIGADGLGIDIKGAVTDETGAGVSTFASTHLGIGAFNFVPVVGKTYKANITYADSTTNTVELPKAINNGYTISLNNANPDTIRIRITAGNEATSGKLSLVAQSGGVVYYAAEKQGDSKIFSATIPKSKFPTGIIQFTLFSQNGEPLNERLAFINHHDQLNLNLKTDKPGYTIRQKVKFKLNPKDKNGKSVTGSFSVAVTDETKVPVDTLNENGILTNLLLTSELKGNIEQPGYYFTNTDTKVQTDLDNLLLTQGYRQFEWKRILSDTLATNIYQPEKAMQISGTVKRNGKPVQGAQVKLFSKTGGMFMLDTLTDVNGKFAFKDLIFADSTKFVVQSRVKKGQDDVTLELDTIQAPQLTIKSYGSGQYAQANVSVADISTYVINQKQFYEEQQKYGINKHPIVLKGVKVEAKYEPKIPHSENLNGSGNADQILTAKDIERFICGKLSDCLIGVLNGIKFQNGVPQVGALVIDGTFVDVETFIDLRPDDIEGIEVIHGAHYGAIYGTRMANGGLIITTKRAKKQNNYYRYAPGVVTYMPKGFYKAREFYSPQYDNPHTNQKMADLRSTIYWNPNIITDKDGKASFEYFNADGKGTYRVVVEGIDADGNLGRQVFRYKVE
ncbi:TonB-dependent receptor [Mucilaginibacter flavidus]|uniref:TonB-dependent receptor n=1 Tax=Mucilaginibacter flavidus TaxID=2949309 RepID=UPI0020929D72|nr:TonB-dependent receptor [Mucilaginibacter flavidus]MCO5945868.1 TonB-dependent receptor [Mucilaginibacter flavidus]